MNEIKCWTNIKLVLDSSLTVARETRFFSLSEEEKEEENQMPLEKRDD